MADRAGTGRIGGVVARGEASMPWKQQVTSNRRPAVLKCGGSLSCHRRTGRRRAGQGAVRLVCRRGEEVMGWLLLVTEVWQTRRTG